MGPWVRSPAIFWPLLSLIMNCFIARLMSLLQRSMMCEAALGHQQPCVCACTLGKANLKLLFALHCRNHWASLVAQLVKNLPAVQETRVQSLNWEDPLEKEMATHSSILAWKISWTEEPGGVQSMGTERVGRYWATNTYLQKSLKRYCKYRNLSNHCLAAG